MKDGYGNDVRLVIRPMALARGGKSLETEGQLGLFGAPAEVRAHVRATKSGKVAAVNHHQRKTRGKAPAFQAGDDRLRARAEEFRAAMREAREAGVQKHTLDGYEARIGQHVDDARLTDMQVQMAIHEIRTAAQAYREVAAAHQRKTRGKAPAFQAGDDRLRARAEEFRAAMREAREAGVQKHTLDGYEARIGQHVDDARLTDMQVQMAIHEIRTAAQAYREVAAAHQRMRSGDAKPPIGLNKGRMVVSFDAWEDKVGRVMAKAVLAALPVSTWDGPDGVRCEYRNPPASQRVGILTLRKASWPMAYHVIVASEAMARSQANDIAARLNAGQAPARGVWRRDDVSTARRKRA